MKDVNQIKQIEDFNKEFLVLYHSKKMRRSRNIYRIKHSSVKDTIRLTRKKIRTKIGDIKIKVNTTKKDDEPFYYNFGVPIENTKVAVYTCITNGYDNAKEPLYIGKDVDYYLFTDVQDKNGKIWNNRKIDCKGFEKEANRHYKFHPDIFEGKYKYAVYIDGNVKVVSDITTICSIAHNSKVGIAMHKHHSRDCAYEEGKACKYYKRGNNEKIREYLNKMKSDGFPSKFGLCEATVIVYDLQNPIAKKIAHQWWNLYYESKTKRDQIFFPYIIWKNGFSMNDVGDLGNNIWNNPKFILYGHD